jgi:hypothetical protein
MASRNNMHEPSILAAVALANRMQGARMKIKQPRFESEPAGVLGSNKSHEALHIKNVIEVSVLGPG